MNIIFLGAPGAGKGTYASRLKERLNIPHISTGDIFRTHIKEETVLGLKAKSYIDKGHLVPDDVVIGLVDDRLKQQDCEKGYILDGFPRTIPQAKALDKVANIDIVINLLISDQEIVKRLAGRRACSCGNTSHIKWLEDGKTCDRCGLEMYQRPDDNEKTVLERLKVYYDQTSPLIEYYKVQGKVRDIKSEGGVEAVMEKIYKVID